MTPYLPQINTYHSVLYIMTASRFGTNINLCVEILGLRQDTEFPKLIVGKIRAQLFLCLPSNRQLRTRCCSRLNVTYLV